LTEEIIHLLAYNVTIPNAAFWAGDFQACKGYKIIGNKHTNS